MTDSTLTTQGGEPAADAATRFGFPGPYALPKAGWGRHVLVGIVLLLLAFSIALGIYQGVINPVGRGVLVDTAASLGLGRPIDGTAAIQSCKRQKFGGRFERFGYRCTMLMVAEGRTETRTIELFDRKPFLGSHPLRRFLGQTGISLPRSAMLDRYDTGFGIVMTALLVLASAVIPVGLMVDRRWARILREGRLREVELLTMRDRPWFSFVDAEGERRFIRSPFGGNALIIDSAGTRGLAIVSGERGMLLHEPLDSLQVEPPARERLLAAVDAMRDASRARPRLAGVADGTDPADPDGTRSLAEIERQSHGRPDRATAERCYDMAWRIAWNSMDPATSTRAFALRDRLAAKVGPEGAYRIQAAHERTMAVAAPAG